MSDPWKYFGSWAPQIEAIIDPMFIGDGTGFPINWDNSLGSIGTDQICRFEWAAKTFRLVCEGTADITFSDPAGVAPDETHSFPFALNAITTPVGGTTWDVLEPGGPNIPDLSVGSRPTILADDTYTTTVVLAWGSGDFAIRVDFEIIGLFAVDGTSFGTYTKGLAIGLTASGSQSTPGFSGIITMSSQSGITVFPPYTPYGPIDIFHSTATIFISASTAPAPNSISFTTFALTVDDEFTQPPNI